MHQTGLFWSRARKSGQAVAMLLLLLLACGCGAKVEPPVLVPVKGKVICQGKAVPGVLLKFWPRESPATPGPQKVKLVEAATGERGEFSLDCPKGSYKVTLVNLPREGAGPGLSGGTPAAPPSSASPVVTVPPKYRDASLTPLIVEVPENGNEALRLTIIQ
jgi:hypothetical protein